MQAHLPVFNRQTGRRRRQLFCCRNLSDFFLKHFGHQISQFFKAALVRFLIIALKVQIDFRLRNVFNCITFIVGQNLRPKLINRIRQQQHFDSLGLKCLQLRIVGQYLHVIAGNIINGLAVSLDSRNILVQSRQFFAVFGRMEIRKRSDFLPVAKIFINTLFKGNAEIFPEFHIVIIVFAAFFQFF